jgi:general secretion pathway protein A
VVVRERTEDLRLEETRTRLEPSLEAPLVPIRPPLRVEEGLIEVGWEGNLEAEAASPMESTAPVATGRTATAGLLDADKEPVSAPPAATEAEAEPELPSEEMIEDHYAALQAWTEWAKNRGRGIDPGSAAGPAANAPEESGDSLEGRNGAPRAARVWSEGQHDHAPYSQLFTRLRQSR